MKQLLLLLIASITLGFTSSDNATKGSIIVELEALKSGKGVVEVSLYNSDQTFLKNNGALITKRQKVKPGQLTIVFNNLPFGSYAAVSYHDINENRQFDRNFVGIPKEPVAVSQLSKKKYSKPKFQEAKVDLHQSEMVVKMHFVKY